MVPMPVRRRAGAIEENHDLRGKDREAQGDHSGDG